MAKKLPTPREPLVDAIEGLATDVQELADQIKHINEQLAELLDPASPLFAAAPTRPSKKTRKKAGRK